MLGYVGRRVVGALAVAVVFGLLHHLGVVL